MEYETKSHCKYLIALHLILVVKYRKKLLQGDLGEFVKQKYLNLKRVQSLILKSSRWTKIIYTYC